MSIQTLASQEGDTKVLHARGPVILDVYQETCPPCRALKPRLVRIAQPHHAPVYRVDIHCDPPVADRFHIKSLPTIRFGRGRLLPIGFAIGGVSAVGLAFDVPLDVSVVLVTMLSLGYDMTQPLLAGIVTDLGSQRGLAMGLNVFLLFTGFGVGSLIFGAMLTLGFERALGWFGTIVLIAAAIAVPLFRDEQVPRRQAP